MATSSSSPASPGATELETDDSRRTRSQTARLAKESKKKAFSTDVAIIEQGVSPASNPRMKRSNSLEPRASTPLDLDTHAGLDSSMSAKRRSKVHCEHCHKTYTDFTKHSEQCKLFPVPCFNNCGASIPRKDLAVHSIQRCPCREIICPYHITGCQEKLKADKQVEHLRRSNKVHLSLLQSHLATHSSNLSRKDFGKLMELMVDCVRFLAKDSDHIEPMESVEAKIDAVAREQGEIWKIIRQQRTNSPPLNDVGSNIVEKCQQEFMQLGEEVKELKGLVQQQKEIIDRQQAMLMQLEQGARGRTEKKVGEERGDKHMEEKEINELVEAMDECEGGNIRMQLDTQAEDIRTCKEECALIRKGLEEVTGLRIRESTERNRGLLIKHSAILVDQQAELTQQKRDLENVETQLKENILPMDFTMTNVSRTKLMSLPFYSPPFYTHKGGYRMCIKVYAEGVGRAYGCHVSIYAYLMRGGYDHNLLWPFQGCVTVQMLNKVVNDNHTTATFNFAECTDQEVVGRVVGKERAKYGVGLQRFLCQSLLHGSEDEMIRHLECNSLQFRILRVANVESSAHLLRRCRLLESFMTSVEPQICLLPMQYVLTDWIQLLKQSNVWVSPAFFSHQGGYRMCLQVYPNGVEDAWGNAMSVFVCLMRGPHDDKVKWPFRGTISIEILNQIRNRDHISFSIVYSADTRVPQSSRVVMGERSDGIGIASVLPHTSLHADNAKKVIYLHNNCLKLRVKSVTLST